MTAAALELKFGILTWIEAPGPNNHAWYSHWHQHRLRARPISPTNWIVSHETAGGWVVIGTGNTMGEVSARAEEWATK